MLKTRVLIVDDHSLVREGLGAMLRMYDDMEVVGEASDGNEALEQTAKLSPDIVLMDIAMPGLGGLEATLEIRKRHPDVKIIVLSQYDDKEYVSRFLKASVSGYILKKAVGSELVAAIRAVMRGECYLYTSIASKVIDEYLGRRAGSAADVQDPCDLLTDREKQVLKLLAEGYSHKEIADSLNISAKTVIAHQSHISEKLDLHNRAGLIKFAFQQGIVRLDP